MDLYIILVVHDAGVTGSCDAIPGIRVTAELPGTLVVAVH